MKIRKILLALALAISLAAAAAAQEKQAPNSSSGAPRLVIESYSHDFGQVKAGEPLKYSFKVKNLGTADLMIQNVAPG